MTDPTDTAESLRAELDTLRREVQELRANEQRLLDSEHVGEERFHRLVKKAPLGLVFVREDGRITSTNDRFFRIVGYTLKEIPDLDTWLSLAYPNPTYRSWVQETWAEAIRRATKDGTDIDPMEYDVTCRDGQVRIIEIGGIVLPDGFLATFIDYTQRREAERELRAANARLARSNRDLEQFAYVASHDLQEPLRMVASYTQLLSEAYSGQLDEQADKFISFAVEGATRMHSLLNDLLEFSRVDSDAAAFVPTSCGDLVAQVLHDLEGRITEAGATVRVGELPTVLADSTQLGQVFQNLLSNALKFHGDEATLVEVSAHRDGTWWEFDISDNGIGIDPRFHDRIFTIFQRLHPRDVYPGTGIGLSIVKKIIERHGGMIRIDSTLGRGARFTFSLPAVFDDIR
jgi:PAS domain S-box-containing protein